MKVVQSKTLIPVAGIALVVPFVTAAVYVGTRAVGGAESGGQGLLLMCLAIVGVLLGAAAGYGRQKADEAREANALHITARGERRLHKAFM
jgi:hypothetical protein